MAVAGEDFCVVAADTRMSEGFNILCRDKGKCCQLTDRCVIASAGQQAERATLHKVLRERIRKGRQPTGEALHTGELAHKRKLGVVHSRESALRARLNSYKDSGICATS